MSSKLKFKNVTIQEADFDVSSVLETVRKESNTIGAVVNFVGLVRKDGNDTGGASFKGLFLEHYPGMTESVIERLVSEAEKKWRLEAVSIIHRVGSLSVGDQIVLVAVASQHRGDAFSAAEFLMDFLKTDAPIWKKQLNQDSEFWVSAKDSDQHKIGEYSNK